MVTSTVEKFEIQQLCGLDGDWLGEAVGYYCLGYVDRHRFYGKAILEWESEQEERLDNGDIDEITSSVPLSLAGIKQRWYRLPIEEELENGDASSENEFMFFDEAGEGLEPITVVMFD